MTGASSIGDRKYSLFLNFVFQEWINRLWQRTHRQGTMKKRLSIHSNAPCLLERRISEHPHFKHTIGFMDASIRTLLPAMVSRHNRFKKGPTGGLICGVGRSGQAMSTDTLYPSKKVNFYLEMLNFS